MTRKHCCPVCQEGVIGGEAGLIRNFLVDDVASTLRRATEETDVAYMRLLFDNAVDAGPGTGAAAALDNENGSNTYRRLKSDRRSPADTFPRPLPHAGDAGSLSSEPMQLEEQQHAIGLARPGQQQHHQGHGLPLSPRPALDLSPVEAVLVKRIREAFLGYQAYYARERAVHEAEVNGLMAQLQAAQREDSGTAVCGGPPYLTTTVGQGGGAAAAQTHAGKVAALQGAIEDSEARFKAGMEALLRDFDTHAAAALPPPSLLPSTVTLIVASRGVRFDTQVLPTHFPENIYSKVGNTRNSRSIHPLLTL